MVDTKDEDIDDEMVWDINREKAMMAPQRIKLVTKYILEHFDQKTYRGDKTYIYNTLTNISQVASGKNGAVEEIKQKQRVSGFNSIFAVASVPMAKLYYEEFKKQMAKDPTKKLRIATIFSYGANEAEYDEGSSGILDEENSEDTSALDQSSRDFLEAAISLFGDKNAGGIVLMKGFKDYYYGYEGIDGKQMPGYADMMEELEEKFPLSEPQIVGEQNQKDFISLFGAILRMRNLLSSFDEFVGKELITEHDLRDYLSRYQDLHDEWKRKREQGKSTDIIDDIVFEVELIKQIEINIDYILMLVKKYHDTHCEDNEMLITITKAIDASPELRSKKELIENFIAGINDVEDVMKEWHDYVAEKREEELVQIIKEEKLKEPETRKFLENAFRDGEIKTAGTDIDKLMPPVSRFGGRNRAVKKQGVIDKMKLFFEKFFGVGGSFTTEKSKFFNYADAMTQQSVLMVAEDSATHGTKKDAE